MEFHRHKFGGKVNNIQLINWIKIIQRGQFNQHGDDGHDDEDYGWDWNVLVANRSGNQMLLLTAMLGNSEPRRMINID